MAGPLLATGRLLLVKLLTNQAAIPASLKVRLFQANLVPTKGDASVLYTANEANYSGYAASGIAAWTVPADDGTTASASAEPAVYVVALPALVGNLIYGYFVTAIADNANVLWAERFLGAPIDMSSPGDAIVVNAEFQVIDQFP